MIVFPHAKINIGLHITGKRPDGYHNIETIFYQVGLCDALEFVTGNKDNKDTLDITGIDMSNSSDNNLVIKAIIRLREQSSFPYLKIHLHKAIPLGAGLGGGSSDASCLLKAVNRHFGLGLTGSDLKSLSLELGSDCPFFIDCKPSFASGRGEVLTPVKSALAGNYLVLLNPGVVIDTREAYMNSSAVVPEYDLIESFERPVTEWKGLITNDFEEYAFKKYPATAELKESLYSSGAMFSLMSGSGSSVYGIFTAKPKLTERMKDFVIWEGMM